MKTYTINYIGVEDNEIYKMSGTGKGKNEAEALDYFRRVHGNVVKITSIKEDK